MGCHSVYRSMGWTREPTAIARCSLTGLLPSSPAPSSSHEDSLLGEGPLERAGARLCLPAGPLRTAARCRYGKRLGLEKTAHILIAGDCGPTGPNQPRGTESGAYTWRPGPPTGAPMGLAPSPATPECCDLWDAIFGDALERGPSQCLFCNSHLQLSSGRLVTLRPQAPSEVAFLRLWQICLTTWLVSRSHGLLLPSNCFDSSETPPPLHHHHRHHCRDPCLPFSVQFSCPLPSGPLSQLLG